MKKGFTLIELLAVIVVLAIIAVIAIPTLINVIEKAKVNALKDSAYGVIESGRLYVAQNQPDQDILFTITNNNITSEQTNKLLKYKGNIKNGIVIVSTSSKVAICIDNGKNYAVKLLDEEEVKTGTGTCESYEAANGKFIVTTPIAEIRKEYERQLEEQKDEYENRISDLEDEIANGGATLVGTYTTTSNIDVSSLNATSVDQFVAVSSTAKTHSSPATSANGDVRNYYGMGWINSYGYYTPASMTLNGNTLSVVPAKIGASANSNHAAAGRSDSYLETKVYFVGNVKPIN